MLAKQATLSDAPKGRSLPLSGVAQSPVHALAIKRKDGHALVMVEDLSWWCLGWVPEAEVTPGTAQGAPSLAVRVPKRQGGTQPSSVLTVPLSTRLLDAPKGAAVGVVLATHEAQVLAVQDGHSKLEIQTPLGALQLWVDLKP